MPTFRQRRSTHADQARAQGLQLADKRMPFLGHSGKLGARVLRPLQEIAQLGVAGPKVLDPPVQFMAKIGMSCVFLECFEEVASGFDLGA